MLTTSGSSVASPNRARAAERCSRVERVEALDVDAGGHDHDVERSVGGPLPFRRPGSHRP